MHINYWQEINMSKAGRAGLIILFVMVLLAVMAPVLSPYSPSWYTGAVFSPPSAAHWLGTDDVGQDIFSRILYGARTSLAVGFGTAFLSVSLSLLVGGTAALFGGFYERFWMRLVDVFIVIPPVIVVILAAAYLRPNLLLLTTLLASFLWPGGARVVRAQTLSLKERMAVAASRTFGAGWGHLLIRHIIPDLGPILIAVLIQNARRAVFLEAGLSFLGVSDPAMISWGKIMQQALRFTYLDVWKWWLLPAGLALSLTITAFTFTGIALEKVLNPRLRREVSHAGN